ncbi:MAG TPA: hypothetical protein VK152_06910 [Paludibacter sp.]|nr:hypothetical protein [Paludibacter sp.]
MNTSILDINRLGLLLKRYFIENKQRELTFWGIVTVVFALMHLGGTTGASISVQMFLFVSGFVFAARSFKFFNFTPGGMHYLMIPATHLEKVVTAILLNTFYYFGMILISYTIGTIVGTGIGNMLFGTSNPVQFELFRAVHENYYHGFLVKNTATGLFDTFITFASIQSVFMLGSVYFKGNAIGKTFLTLFGLGFVLTLIELSLLKITFGTFHFDSHMAGVSLADSSDFFNWIEITGEIFKYGLIPFFWVVTYFRLTEKQI